MPPTIMLRYRRLLFILVGILLLLWNTAMLWRHKRSTEQNSELLSTPEPADANDSSAYVFYATTDMYACSALVNIYRLQHLFHTIYTIHVLTSPEVGPSMLRAMEATNATVHVQDPPSLAPGSNAYYQDCLLKLFTFKMHLLSPGLKRVLVLDADQLILKSLDGLFTATLDTDLAAPRAYWLGKDTFSSTFMLINLSTRLWDIVSSAIATVAYDKYDMDLVNELFGDTAMILSGEYVTINSHWEDWNLPGWYRPSSSAQDANPMGLTTRPSVPLPENHTLAIELHRLYQSAAVLHFFALGKPWTVSADTVATDRPGAHPLMSEQFETWRQTAMDVCPGRI